MAVLRGDCGQVPKWKLLRETAGEGHTGEHRMCKGPEAGAGPVGSERCTEATWPEQSSEVEEWEEGRRRGWRERDLQP